MDTFTAKDLVARWVYTRRGVQKLVNRGDFPRPVTVRVRYRQWNVDAVLKYEKEHPELTDDKLKKRKVAAFARCQNLKRLGIKKG